MVKPRSSKPVLGVRFPLSLDITMSRSFLNKYKFQSSSMGAWKTFIYAKPQNLKNFIFYRKNPIFFLRRRRYALFNRLIAPSLLRVPRVPWRVFRNFRKNQPTVHCLKTDQLPPYLYLTRIQHSALSNFFFINFGRLGSARLPILKLIQHNLNHYLYPTNRFPTSPRLGATRTPSVYKNTYRVRKPLLLVISALDISTKTQLARFNNLLTTNQSRKNFKMLKTLSIAKRRPAKLFMFSNPQINTSLTTLRPLLIPVFLFYKKFIQSLKLKRKYFQPTHLPYVGSYFTNYINQFFSYKYNARTAVLFNFEIMSHFSTKDFIISEIIKSRLMGMSGAFSTIFFVREYADALYLAFKVKSFKHLINYLNRMLKSLIFYDHKRFLVFFFETIREQYYPLFDFFSLQGVSVSIKGKIGVGGNSRKRRMRLNLGKTTRVQANLNVYELNTWLNTRTGALGIAFQMFFFNETESVSTL